MLTACLDELMSFEELRDAAEIDELTESARPGRSGSLWAKLSCMQWRLRYGPCTCQVSPMTGSHTRALRAWAGGVPMFFVKPGREISVVGSAGSGSVGQAGCGSCSGPVTTAPLAALLDLLIETLAPTCPACRWAAHGSWR